MSVILVLPMLLVANVKDNFCILLWTEDWMPMAYDWIWFVLVALSTALMVGLYSRVVYNLWFNRNDDNQLNYQQRVSTKTTFANTFSSDYLCAYTF